MKKKIFDAIVEYGYSKKAAYAHLSGTRLPSYGCILKLHNDGVIPFHAWRDISSYLNNHDTPTQTKTSRVKRLKNQPKETA